MFSTVGQYAGCVGECSAHLFGRWRRFENFVENVGNKLERRSQQRPNPFEKPILEEKTVEEWHFLQVQYKPISILASFRLLCASSPILGRRLSEPSLSLSFVSENTKLGDTDQHFHMVR